MLVECVLEENTDMDRFKLFADLNNIPKSVYPNFFDYNERIHFTPEIENCDFVLLPHWEVVFEYSDQQYIEKGLNPKDKPQFKTAVESLIHLARKHNKRIIVFHFSDVDKKINLPNSLVFRTSLYGKQRGNNEFAIPSNKGDLLKEYRGGKFHERSKLPKPTVSFTGSSRPLNPNLMDLVRGAMNVLNSISGQKKTYLLQRYAWNSGQILRRKAMKKLMRNDGIKTHFKIMVRRFFPQKTRSETDRLEFVESIFNSDYVLCARGAGNYSYRFYETLSAGRIPIFVNTDCVLPLDDIIDWKKYCVWIEEDELEKIDELLLEFHDSLSEDDFIELQIKIRNLWLEWIQDKAFLSKFHIHLRRYISGQTFDLKI